MIPRTSAIPEKSFATLSAKKTSDCEDEKFEDDFIELSDDSITLYSAIHYIWHEYQEKIKSIPCLDFLSVLASQELLHKNT
jgi:hypothetical protein